MSLIEVIVSMFMITVLLVLYTSALNTVALTRKQTYADMAYHAANKQMESLRDMPNSALPPSGNISDPLLSQLPSGSGSYTVSNYPGFGGMKEIVVTINWNDGQSKFVVLRTLSGNGGLNP
jgi:hypothetical protein